MPFERYNPNRPVEPTLPTYSTNKLADPPPRLSQRDYTTLSRDEALDLAVGAFLVEKSRGAESWQWTYSQQILSEFGWITDAKGRGVDPAMPGSGYSQI